MFIHKFGNYRETFVYKNGMLCIYKRGADNKIRLEVEIQMTEEQAKKLKAIFLESDIKPCLFKLTRRQAKRKLKL